MKPTVALICLLALVTAGTALAGISVDHDKSVDFSKYRTFTVREANEPISPLMRQRMINAIEVELGADGMEKVDTGADLLVVIHTSTDEEVMITADDWGYGGYRRWGGWGGWGTTTVDVRSFDVGTLLIDIVDAKSNQLVWRGIATDSIPTKTEKIERKIYKAVDKLFRHFPPDE